MKAIVTRLDEIIGPWVAARCGEMWIPQGATTIGLMDGAEILFGAIYNNFNRTTIEMHIAAASGKRWMTKDLLWFCFYYPFVQLGVKRITVVVPETNLDAIAFDKHLGFTFEAALEKAHPDGDLHIYRLFREDCRWLNLRGRNAQKTRQISSDALPGHPTSQEGIGSPINA